MKLDHSVPDIAGDLAKFIRIGQPEIKTEPYQSPKAEVIRLAIKLIEEEVNEELVPHMRELLTHGYSIERMAAIMDDCVDSIYVITWAMQAFNLPFNAHWNEVQKANMAKFPKGNGELHPETGETVGELLRPKTAATMQLIEGHVVYRNEHGKVQKPEGWKPPDHWQVLHSYWEALKNTTQPDVIDRKNYYGNLPPK